jgi:hypothetical protein
VVPSLVATQCVPQGMVFDSPVFRYAQDHVVPEEPHNRAARGGKEAPMAHHKRRRPKSTRAGCLFCKELDAATRC